VLRALDGVHQHVLEAAAPPPSTSIEQQMMTLKMRVRAGSLAPSLAYDLTYRGDILIEEACAGSPKPGAGSKLGAGIRR